MTAKQLIKSGIVIMLGTIQFFPVLLLTCDSISGNMLGVLYVILLLLFWRSTRIGRWYFRELWRSTLRLERVVFGDNTEC